MKVEIHHTCRDFRSYRAERVKSLFNCDEGYKFDLEADLPIENQDWQIGLVVGPSGSGKTSIGKAIFGESAMVDLAARWPERQPIIDAMPGTFDEATAAFSAVGLGSVPAWLRPFHVLSNGEKFRAGLARLLCDQPETAVVDEWTSVIDRQIARIGSLAFAKAWRRNGSKIVLLSCHYDVIPWLQPDWVFDTATGKFSGACLHRRPKIDLQIWETDWSYWPLFEPHHYLKLPRMIASTCFVGTVDNEPVCHLATSPRFEIGCMRACRMVVMPEWQGAGIGLRFLDAVCERQARGLNRWGKKTPTLFHTSHPGLAAALRRSPRWKQCSAVLCGDNRERSKASLQASARKAGSKILGAGYGGHFRAVQGFKFIDPCAS